MDVLKILQALAVADELLTAATAAYDRTRALITQAQAEGRDITDAELDALKADRTAAIDAFKKAHG